MSNKELSNVDIKTADDLSLDVTLERRERSYSFGEPRMAHYGGRAAKQAINPKDTLERIRRLGTMYDEQLAIRDVIVAFERLSPDQVVEAHGKLTTDPYISVSEGVTNTVDIKRLREWVEGRAFEAIRKAFGNTDPELAELTQLSITMVDEATAAVTYTMLYGKERMPGTSSVIVTRADDGGWRIAVHTPHPVT